MSVDDTILAPGSPPIQSRRFKRYAWMAGGGVGLVLVAFVYGYLTGRGELGAAEARIEKATKELTQCKVQAAQDLNQANARGQLLEARRSLDQAVSALDARNFGTAQQRLKESALKLGAARVEGRLLAVAKELDAIKLVATDDVGGQRQKLSALLIEFDQWTPVR
jgi:hypothetical protein